MSYINIECKKSFILAIHLKKFEQIKSWHPKVYNMQAAKYFHKY